MAARIIDGRALADSLRARTASAARELTAARGRKLCLAAVLIGGDAAAESYARSQEKAAGAVGIEYRLVRLGAGATQHDASEAISALNADGGVTGVMLHLPVPSGLDAFALQQRIAPEKDVEGVSAANLGLVAIGRGGLVPCTAAAAFECIRATGEPIEGREAVIVGRSTIVGRPLAALLVAAHATVTICHTRTRDLGSHARRAELLVAAAGRAGLIGAADVRPGTIVIDVGTNRVDDGQGRTRMVGDVQFDEVREVAGWITPVPGGVGPVTSAMLMANVVSAARRTG